MIVLDESSDEEGLNVSVEEAEASDEESSDADDEEEEEEDEGMDDDDEVSVKKINTLVLDAYK